jgi:HemY protein
MPAARICRLMAALEDAERSDDAATRLWLGRASEAPPDPLWVCTSCGAESRDWQPLCARCRGFDSLVWRVPTRAVAALAAEPRPDGAGPHPVALIASPPQDRVVGSVASWSPPMSAPP